MPTATAAASPVFGSDADKSATVTGEWNVSQGSWLFAWQHPAGTAMPQEETVVGPSLRDAPATIASLLKWGRQLFRTGSKKIDLDLD
jgi:hypothetical protein